MSTTTTGLRAQILGVMISLNLSGKETEAACVVLALSLGKDETGRNCFLPHFIGTWTPLYFQIRR